jgi:L-cysteine:1D-myo-inositol 2-amino-2-deoxy-alpha-D-glucopyranoside ligase
MRWLAPGREVTYIQNVTDIDDSILARARKLGVDWRSLGDKQTEDYREDMAALHVTGPKELVRATSAISTIHTLIQALLDRSAAYVVEGGSVFFRVRSRPSYGELSRLSRDQMLQIAGQQDDADLDDPRKEDPLDFALWKGWSGQADEPCWQSPWGPGRPGWHIECSALCLQHLGRQVTIHGGGADLVFPHHESEIAQSETALGVRPFAQIWSHVAIVHMDGEKMSKSLGNMVFVRKLLEEYSPNAVRLYLLAHQYRQVWEWSASEASEAGALAAALETAARAPDTSRADAGEAFADALAHDLNTPAAIEALSHASGTTLRNLSTVLGLEL